MPAGHDENRERIGIRAVRGDRNRTVVRSAAQAPATFRAAWLRRRGATLLRARRDVDVPAALRLLSTRDELHHFLAHAERIRPQVEKDDRGDPFPLADEPEEYVLGADVAVIELQCLTKAELEDLLGPRRERRELVGEVPGTRFLLDLPAYGLAGDPEGFERSAPTPSPSSISPSRMCSVPMKG